MTLKRCTVPTSLATFQVAALAIKQLDGLDLTFIEKVKLGRAHGVPQWLKDGYTALVRDVTSASLEELQSLGSETAIRILYAQNQTHLLPKDSSLYCGYCQASGNGRHGLQYYETGQFAGTYRCTYVYCGSPNPSTSGYEAYTVTQVDLSGSKPLSNTSVAGEVAKVFKDQIDEAERRNSSSMA